MENYHSTTSNLFFFVISNVILGKNVSGENKKFRFLKNHTSPMGEFKREFKEDGKKRVSWSSILE